MDILEQILPFEIVYAMVYSDESALTTDESYALGEYSAELVSLGYNAIPLGTGIDVGFYSSNNLNNIGCNCLKVSFQKI